MSSLRGPADQASLRDAHLPPLQAVITDWPFEKLDHLARRNAADEVLVDARSAPDVVICQRRIGAYISIPTHF